MPVPRRFDRQPPERDTTRINERIRVPEVRLIGDDGEQVGILKTPDALAYAQERDLDLVEVAPDAKPPVCRVLDYSKYKFEQAQRQKAARKHQQKITIREIKFRPKIAIHDYETKKGHVTRFLKAKDKVKVTIMFRGREVAHPERGEMILDRLAEDLAELAIVEQRPQQDGRNMTMMLGPSKAVIAGKLGEGSGDTGEIAAVAAPDGTAAAPAAESAAPAAEQPAAEVAAAPAADEPAAEVEAASEPEAEAPPEPEAEAPPEPEAEAPPEPEPAPEPEEPSAEEPVAEKPKPAPKAKTAAKAKPAADAKAAAKPKKAPAKPRAKKPAAKPAS